MKIWLPILTVCAAYLASNGADARNTGGQDEFASKIQKITIQGQITAPIGYVDFCRHNPGDCLPQGQRITHVNLTTKKLRELRTINSAVNKQIQPLSDLIQYRTVEKWTFPTSGKGDCEDYVLLKQRELMARGWPQSALLITVVRDENNEGHAVLTVRTDLGDLILDNKNSKIMAWNQTLYTYIKWQSSVDPRSWESLVPLQEAPSVAASGADRRN